MKYNKNILELDSAREIERISAFIYNVVRSQKKDGVVVGLSGGIDSAVVASLCVNALGKDKVFGLILPEKESNPKSRIYAKDHAVKLGIDHEIVDITPILEAFGTYGKRDSIISRLYPEYDPSVHNIRIALPSDLLNRDAFNIFTLTIDDGNRNIFSSRLGKKDLNGIIAATDTKQRTRMMNLYFYAESMNRLVCGTTNRPEALQGFFVKYGDGGVDLEPIEHLYKKQVYQLAKELDVPKEIIDRKPSPDTFNSQIGDEEFFFRMPYTFVDLLLYAWEHEVPVEDVCSVLNLSPEQVNRAFRDIDSKFRSTKHLRELPPSLL